MYSYLLPILNISLLSNQLVGILVKDIAFGAGGLRFDSRAAEIGRGVDNVLPPLRRLFAAALPKR